jgi:MerR family transcriptional regulator, light-induced transcriptional regulator
MSEDGRGGPVGRMAKLVRTVEAEIIPRLVLARRSPVQKVLASPAAAGRTDEQEVLELTRLLLAHDVAVASAYVDSIRERGISAQRICLELLAPAARMRGVMWERDECDFMKVTLGLCRLHQVLHQLHSTKQAPRESGWNEQGRSALLVSAPGEQHTFGLVMVGQFFRLAGWDVCNEFPRTDDELVELVQDNWFGMVGLSVGSEVRLGGIASVIRAIRRASRNKRVIVMLGGPMLVRQPQLAADLGADATAADGKQAAVLATAMLLPLTGPHSGDANATATRR